MPRFDPYKIAQLVPPETKTFTAANPDGSGNDFSITVRRLPEALIVFTVDRGSELAAQIASGAMVLQQMAGYPVKVSERFAQMLCEVHQAQVATDPSELYDDVTDLFAVFYHTWTHDALRSAAAFAVGVDEGGAPKPTPLESSTGEGSQTSASAVD